MQAAAAAAVLWLALAAIRPSLAVWLVREDGLVQWLQFALLAATAVVLIAGARAARERGARRAFALLAALTIMLAMEEISWGQRVLGIATPAFIREANVQGELTLHNLEPFQRYRHWLLILFGAAGLGLIAARADVERWARSLAPFVPRPGLWVGFALVLAGGLAFEAGHLWSVHAPSELSRAVRFWVGRYSEIAELQVPIVALAYAAATYRRARTRRA